MPTPRFILDLRAGLGHGLLWLTAAVGAVLDDQGQVLLQRRADSGRWTLPGGIVEPGEQPADAAVREVYEETGVVAVPEALTSVAIPPQFAYPNGDQVRYLDLTFRCRAVGGAARVNDSESIDVAWRRLDELPDLSDIKASQLRTALAGRPEASFIFSGLNQVLGLPENW
ncbi:MAG TPA: NUDIX domain-containing protein [Streptosporangiaceae bacterium]